jgi:hypothetical protein
VWSSCQAAAGPSQSPPCARPTPPPATPLTALPSSDSVLNIPACSRIKRVPRARAFQIACKKETLVAAFIPGGGSSGSGGVRWTLLHSHGNAVDLGEMVAGVAGWLYGWLAASMGSRLPPKAAATAASRRSGSCCGRHLSGGHHAPPSPNSPNRLLSTACCPPAGEMLPLYEELSRLLRCNILSYDYAGWGPVRLPARCRSWLTAGRAAVAAARTGLCCRRCLWPVPAGGVAAAAYAAGAVATAAAPATAINPTRPPACLPACRYGCSSGAPAASQTLVDIAAVAELLQRQLGKQLQDTVLYGQSGGCGGGVLLCVHAAEGQRAPASPAGLCCTG